MKETTLKFFVTRFYRQLFKYCCTKPDVSLDSTLHYDRYSELRNDTNNK